MVLGRLIGIPLSVRLSSWAMLQLDLAGAAAGLALIAALPDWSPAVDAYLISKRQDAAARWVMYLTSANKLALFASTVTPTTFINSVTTASISFTDGTEHEISVVVVRATASRRSSRDGWIRPSYL